MVEALMMLAVVGVVIGLSAPLISRQLNNSQVGGWQLLQVEKRIERIEKSISKKSDEVLNPTILSRIMNLSATVTELNTTLSNKITGVLDRVMYLENFVGASSSKPVTEVNSLHARVTELENLKKQIELLQNNQQSQVDTTKLIPSGAVMYFDLEACPSGWTALSSIYSSASGSFIRNMGEADRRRGSYQASAVPNLKGHFPGGDDGTVDGVLFKLGATLSASGRGSSDSGVYMDASNYSSVYTNGVTEVRPNNIALLACRKN